MTPTIAAVVGVYNSEQWIAETLDGILGQTRPPDEIIVVDDGSLDGTGDVLRHYGNTIRVVHQPNGGCPCAFNTAFRAARSDYIAMCGADDVWEPHKLEWQLEALRSHPEVDVVFGGADLFGTILGSWPAAPGTGILDCGALLAQLHRHNFICASSILIRRTLTERLGPFIERFGAPEDQFWARLGMGAVYTNRRFSADDYDYWMRALRAGAMFYYEPRTLVRYRRHDDNVTRDSLWVHRSALQVRHLHGDLVPNGLRRSVRAADLFRLGRLLIDEGHPREARTAFMASLRLRPGARRIAWALVASLPERTRGGLLSRIRLVKHLMAASSTA